MQTPEAPSAKQQFETEAESYAARARDPKHFLTECSQAVAVLIARNARGRRALDVGCGAGTLSALLAARGFDVFGCDIAPNMVSHAVTALASTVDDADSRFRVSDAGHIPFEGLQFDVVSAIGMLPYVRGRGTFIEEMASLLVDDGVLVVSSLNRLSVYVAWGVARRLLSRHAGERIASVRRLVSTGLLSGGYVDARSAENVASAAALDKVMSKHGFCLVDARDMYCLRGMDRHAPRSAVSRMIARRFGWQHIGVYWRRGRA